MKGKRIISVLLTLMLVLNIALAVEGKAEAASVKESVAEKVHLTGQQIEKKARTYGYTAFKAKTIINSSTSNQAYTYVYDLPAGYYDVVEVTVANTGYLYLDCIVESGYATSSNVDVYLVDEENMLLATSGQRFSSYDTSYGLNVGSTDKNVGAVYTPADETRYVIINNKQSDNVVSVGVRGKVFTTGSRNLSQGTSKWTIVSGRDKDGNSSSTWFKVKPDRTGVMTVSLKEYGYSGSTGTVRLYSSGKKALSNDVNYNSSSNTVYFGVKKGTTYYLKVTNCSGSTSYNYRYGIKYGMTKYTDRALGSKSDAKLLKRKADATSTLFTASTSTSTDWYKFNVSSKRATRIAFNTKGIKSGDLTITIYKGSTKIGTDTIPASYNGQTYDITYGTTWGKANSGTYYVKVVKSSRASGKYTIRYTY